jgi:hypothetical protein
VLVASIVRSGSVGVLRVLAAEPPSDDGGHVCLVASIVRLGSVGVLRVLAAEPPSDDGGQIEPSGPGIPVCAQVMGQTNRQECLIHLQFVR